MSRELSAGLQAAVAAEVVRPVFLVYLDFPSGAVRVNSGIYSLTYDGQTYTAVGALGEIGAINEPADFSSPGLDLKLSGLDPALITAIYGDHYQGRTAIVYVGFLNESHALIDADELFSGRIDHAQVEVGETATIILRCENELVDWERPKIRRYNDADQKGLFPGDRAFEAIEYYSEGEIIWGR